jgi:hypothetical protein
MAASSSPPATALMRTIVVGPPLARIVITSRPDTVLLGKPVLFRVVAYDRAGKPVRGVPIELMIQVGPYTQLQDATRPSPVRFEASGRRRVIAAFRGLADTLTVTVVDPSRSTTATPPPPSP